MRKKKINCATIQKKLSHSALFFQHFVGSVIVASLPESNQGLKIQPFLTGSICYCPSTTSQRLLISPPCSLESPSVSSLAETFVSSIKLRSLSCFGGGIILHGSGILCRRTSVAFLSHLESCLPVLTGRRRGGGVFKPKHIMSPFRISEQWNEIKQKKQNIAKRLRVAGES